MNNLPAMDFPFGARGNNFDSQIKIIYSWSKLRTPYLSQVDLSVRVHGEKLGFKNYH